jgi:23S rRNA U2552 (ribose-2'-O)-methylase RlmE/FtsJ
MLYFLLPKINQSIYTKLKCTSTEDSRNTLTKLAISHSLSYYLSNIKEKIKGREDEWDSYKKYTNPYEYIHTQVPYKKNSVAKYKPLSRAYFKMIEILENFHLHNIPSPISTFHLAEGPGGFIEALAHLRNCEQDVYRGMTLLDHKNDDNIPAWKKTDLFLKEHTNVLIENGADGTGNILSLENLDYCKQKYGSSMNIITADGGFDFSMDFNNQESNMSRLLFAQICFALAMQKQDGSFVLKIFDSFTEATIDMLYILSAFYRKVYITKPQTSRSANSEKYVVCSGFIPESIDGIYTYIRQAFQEMMAVPENMNIYRFLEHPISHYFITRLEEYNAIFGQQQIENIHNTLTLMDYKQKGEKIETIVKLHISKCIVWCNKHNVPFSPVFKDIEFLV